MDIVTQHVKSSILNHFTLFPSRLHVLREVILGNGTGYQWVKDPETETYILSDGFERENVTSIKKEEVDNSFDIKGKHHPSTGDAFYNHVASFVEENIDVYASSAFYTVTLNLNPKKPCDFSRGYNRLCDAPDLGLIHPDWLEAINELVDFELKLRNPWGGNVTETQAIDLLVRDHRAWVDQYKLLLRFKEKYSQYKAADIEKSKQIIQSFGTPIEQKYEKSAHRSVITLDEYREYREVYLDSSDVIHYELDHWIKWLLDTESKYVDNGRLNATFVADATEVLNKSRLLNRFNQFATMNNEISRALEIHSLYRSQVQAFVNDYGMNGLLGY